MLVLTRKPGESIVLHHGGQVVAVVKVLKTKGAQVHYGIDAPAELEIDREEVWQRKESERVIRERIND